MASSKFTVETFFWWLKLSRVLIHISTKFHVLLTPEPFQRFLLAEIMGICKMPIIMKIWKKISLVCKWSWSTVPLKSLSEKLLILELWQSGFLLDQKNLIFGIHYIATLKGAIQVLGQFLITGSTSKIMKNAFYFTLKARFVLKIFKFLSWLFGHVEKTARLER